MKKLDFIAIVLALFFPLFIACTASGVPTSEIPVAAQEKPTAPVKTGWEAEWEKILKTAQKEGKVVIYAVTPGPAVRAASPLFKQKFGIDLEVVSGTGSELTNKISGERRSGLYMTDVLMGGMNSLFTVSLPGGWPDPMEPELLLPEVKNPDNWLNGKLPWGDEEHKILSFLYYVSSSSIVVNTDLVRPNEITSYYDLLAPKWKDKILIGDAQIAGSAFNSFSTLVRNKVLDLDYFRKLAKQGQVLRNESLVADWVAKGKYPIAVFGTTVGIVGKYKEAGAPITEIDVKEGSYYSNDSSGTIVLNRRPHPNAARIFINWWFSKEAQIHTQKILGYQSARIDIGTEGVNPQVIRKSGVTYFPSANISRDFIVNEQDNYLKQAQEIFGGL